jgi:dinuclear metal center YbgI/SA1388 family protein
MLTSDLVQYLDEYLGISAIRDYGPQGLQVEGRRFVNKIVGLVDAQMPCVEAALQRGADMMLVHHGIFWGPTQLLRGQHGALVRTIMDSGLNLYAAHLALDAHREVGNNAELSRRLGLEPAQWWAEVNGVALAALSYNADGIKFDYLADRFEQLVGPLRLVQPHGPRIIHRVGVMSGSGAQYIGEAAALGCDLFITGETDHAHYYDALNHSINVIYGGHYYTETVGVQALGQHLQDEFNIEFEFADLPTGL